MLKHDTKPGFTLVELLIVIVVIAILAAISIVSYNGIQRRAYNQAVINQAGSWTKLINAYYVVNGTLTVGSGGSFCLGTAEQYPATSDLDEGRCIHDVQVSEDVTDAIGDIGNINMTVYQSHGPHPHYGEGGVGDTAYRGLQYVYRPENSDAVIVYDLYGTGQDCGLSQAFVADSNHYGSATMCYVYFEDPPIIY